MKPRNSLGVILAWAAALLVAAPASAFDDERDPFDDAIRQAVEVILKVREKGQTVTVGEIADPVRYQSRVGVGIRRRIVTELKRNEVETPFVGGDLAVRGEAILKPDGAWLNLEIQDEDGNPVRSPKLISAVNATAKANTYGPARPDRVQLLSKVVAESKTDDALPQAGSAKPAEPEARPVPVGLSMPATNPLAVAKLMGSTIDLEQFLLQKRRAATVQDVRQLFDNPSTAYKSGAGMPDVYMLASKDSPFSMGVMVKGKPISLVTKESHPYFELEEGTEFEIALFNSSKYLACCFLEIDGVNMFALSTECDPYGQPEATKWLVQPKKPRLVAGWYKTRKEAERFKISTDDDNFPAKELGVAGSIGTIRATFAAIWVDDQPYPPEVEMRLIRIFDPERARLIDQSRNGPRYGKTGPTDMPHIGGGRTKEQDIRVATDRYTFGTERAILTLRYRLREKAE